MNENDIKRAQEVVDNWDKNAGGSTAHLFQAALTLAQAFTLSRQGYQSEQALRVQEQNRADRMATEASTNNAAAHEAEQKLTHRARTIIVTRTAYQTEGEEKAAAEAWKAKGKDQAYYPMRGGYWQVEEDGKLVEGLAVEEATHAVMQLMINMHPDRMRLQSIDEMQHNARENGRSMGRRDAERKLEQVTDPYFQEVKPAPDPQDNDTRYTIITMAIAGILKDFGLALKPEELILVNVYNDWISKATSDWTQRGYSPYNAATLRHLGQLMAATMNASRREWEQGGQPAAPASPDIGDAIAMGLVGYRPDMVTAKGEGVTLKTRPRQPTGNNLQAEFYEQGMRTMGIDLGKGSDTTTWSEQPARGVEEMEASKRAEVDRLKARVSPTPMHEPDKSGSVK